VTNTKNCFGKNGPKLYDFFGWKSSDFDQCCMGVFFFTQIYPPGMGNVHIFYPNLFS